MIQECTTIEKDKLANGQCPDCFGRKFIEGPRGGECVNVKCEKCGSWFNIVPGIAEFAQRIHIPPPLNSLDLDIMNAEGCTMPNCDHVHHEGPFFIRPGCHLDINGAKVSYDEGILKLQCPICDKLITMIRVAAP